jgi:hypothetical protein
MPPTTRGGDDLKRSEAALEHAKKQTENAKKETAKLKRQLNTQIAEAQQQCGRKKQRTSRSLWQVNKNDEMSLFFSLETKKTEYRKKKFLASEHEIEELVFDIALRSSLGDDLSALDADDQDEMARRFTAVYGDQCAKDINNKRSNWQQMAKKAFFEMLKAGTPISGAQLLHVAQRQGVFLYDEVVSEDNPQEQATLNKARNLKNKKWRDIFDNFNDKFIANCLGQQVWGFETRSLKTISGRDGTTPAPITVSDEAMIVLLVLNAEKKWLVQYKAKEAGKVAPDRRDLRHLVLYSDDAAGSCKFGGWHKPGRLLFHKVRTQIKKGRSLNTTKMAEEQSTQRLFVKHDMEAKLASKKRKPKQTVPKIDLVGADIGFDSDGSCEFAGYESDEDAKKLLADAMAPPEAPPAAAAAPQAGNI